MLPAVEQQCIDSFSSSILLISKEQSLFGYNCAWEALATDHRWPVPAEHIGDNWLDVAGEWLDTSTECIQGVEQVLNGEISHFVHRYKVEDDQQATWLDVHVDPYHGRTGGVLLRIDCAAEDAEKERDDDADCHLHETLFHELADGVIYQNLSGMVEFANPAAEKMFGLTLEQMLGRRSTDKRWKTVDESQNEIPGTRHPGMLALRTGKAQLGVVMGVYRPDGDLCWVKANAAVVRDKKTKKINGVLTSFVDITREKVAETALQVISERLQLAIDSAGIGTWEWIAEGDQIIWDKQMFRLYGFLHHQDVTAKEVWRLTIHPEDRDRVEYAIRRSFKTKNDVRAEFKAVWPDQSIHHMRAQARIICDESGKVTRLVGVNWDITKEIAAEKRLQEMAYNDELTGVANRTTFNFRLNRAIARARRTKKCIGVMVMDLDNFKDVNDAFGHPIGDMLLVEVVQRLLPLLEKRDTFARLGGDEFAILLEDLTELSEARGIAHKLQTALKEPIYLKNGPSVNTQISIGISMYPDDGEDAIDLVKAADLAMYEAKKSGRNAITAYTKGLATALTKKVTLELLLREAIREQQFQLYYQPIVDLDNRRLLGCEALIRWWDSAGQFVSPAEFIPIAEDCGLIYEIGHWVNQTAFKQWKKWHNMLPEFGYMSVNVSPLQFHNVGFIDDLMKVVKDSDVDPKHILLEITEGTFLQETMNAGSYLRALEDAGFGLAIDDFGTGYSSLAYLKRFNVDVIKIDRSFVCEIKENKADQDIVNAILAMTKNLGFKTLVEGIEDNEQADLLCALGCQYAQGYYFGKPISAMEFERTYIKRDLVLKRP